MWLRYFGCATRVLLHNSGCPRTSFGPVPNFRFLHVTAATSKGHSKWQNIQATKTKNDSKRSSLLQRYGRLIKVAVKFGGFDMKMNSKLAALQLEFKEKNLPFETFEKFLDNLKNRPEHKYWLDVIGPGGSFFIIEVETDSKSRTTNSITKLFKQLGQFRFSQDNNVRTWFESKGVVVLSANRPPTDEATTALPPITLEQAEEIAINVDCEEVTAIEDEDGNPAFEIVCEASAVEQVEQRLTEMNLRVLSAEVEYRAMNTVQLDENSAKLAQRFYQLIEDNTEILKVFDNIDPGEDVAAAHA